jgi:hypothetical protein
MSAYPTLTSDERISNPNRAHVLAKKNCKELQDIKKDDKSKRIKIFYAFPIRSHVLGLGSMSSLLQLSLIFISLLELGKLL